MTLLRFWSSPPPYPTQRLLLILPILAIIFLGFGGWIYLDSVYKMKIQIPPTPQHDCPGLGARGDLQIPPPPQVDVVLTFAMGYPAPMFHRFLASFRAYDHDSMVVLFVTKKEKDNRDIANLATWFHASLVVATYDLYKDLWPHVLHHPGESSAFFSQTNTAGYRFGYQWAWLTSYRGPPDLRYVFLTDFRDVVFQNHLFDQIKPTFQMWVQQPHRNPSFLYPPHPEWPTRQTARAAPSHSAFIIAFPEGRRTNLGKCKYNRAWLGEVYGFALADRWKNRHVICAGTVLGNREGILQWLVRMIEEIEKFAQTGRYNSNDQGIHNYLIHSDDLIRNMTVYLANNEYNEMVTTMAQVTVTRENVVGWIEPELNFGRRAAVIHQGDRLPEYWRSVEQKYQMYLSSPRRHYRGG